MVYFRAEKNRSICEQCIYRECATLIPCPVEFRESDCMGCGACALACPRGGVSMIKAEKSGEVTVFVDGKSRRVSEKISVKRALKDLGYRFGNLPQGAIGFCETGGCYSCAVTIDEKIRPACVTVAREGTRIETELPGDYKPRRIVGGFMGHEVGGVGTPWNLKSRGVVEVALFAAGCNFRCPQCQNWTIAYRGKESFDYWLLSPAEAAQQMTRSRKKYGVNRIAISGGESTLNPRWLLEYLRSLKRLNPDPAARFHVDTNGSLLTPEYIDSLVDAGMTDVGIDLKAWHSETFMRICGLTDETMAESFKETAWHAVRYIRENYRDRIFLGIGLPYNEQLISLEELEIMGREICAIDPAIQVCALDYRPEFKRSRIPHPPFFVMEEVYGVLKGTGLKTVLCQTIHGHIGP